MTQTYWKLSLLWFMKFIIWISSIIPASASRCARDVAWDAVKRGLFTSALSTAMFPLAALSSSSSAASLSLLSSPERRNFFLLTHLPTESDRLCFFDIFCVTSSYLQMKTILLISSAVQIQNLWLVASKINNHYISNCDCDQQYYIQNDLNPIKSITEGL